MKPINCQGNPYPHGRIPAQPFIEIVSTFLEKVEMGEIFRSTAGYDNARSVPQVYSAIEAVGGWAGINHDSLRRMLQGRSATVDFNFADKVICATVGPDAWHSDPELNEQYNRVSLAAA